MAGRFSTMFDEETNEVFAEDDEEERTRKNDDERVVKLSEDKRRRRVSDVIDSIGDREGFFPAGFRTPRRSSTYSDMTSPDQSYCATPGSMTPDSLNIFMPEWLQKRLDSLDAAPNTFTEDSPSTSTGHVASMPVDIDDDCYNMNHKSRGKCVVFNHEHFNTSPSRDGSTVDVNRIEQTFQNLGFEVEVLNNLRHAEVIDKITNLSAENYEDADCICIFMLTHGMSDDMIWAKDVAYKTDAIWKPFTADKCASLAGKPKLFFFQACRGDGLDPGVTLNGPIRTRLITETDSVVTSYKIPTFADFLIVHSSVQGFYSWRNPIDGTWFVQCLCQILDEQADKTDLLKMLTKIARKIATERASYHDLDPLKHDKKQVPSLMATLLRDIYFFPK